jgi:hypothetical protein
MSENITSNKDKLVFQLNNLLEGIIIKRPSKIIKSPYVADIIFEKNPYGYRFCSMMSSFFNVFTFHFSLKIRSSFVA